MSPDPCVASTIVRVTKRSRSDISQWVTPDLTDVTLVSEDADEDDEYDDENNDEYDEEAQVDEEDEVNEDDEELSKSFLGIKVI